MKKAQHNLKRTNYGELKNNNLYRFTLIFIFCTICFIACNQEENAFNKAETDKSLQLYQNFIQKYPNSKWTNKAKQRISELNFWMKADSFNIAAF